MNTLDLSNLAHVLDGFGYNDLMAVEHMAKTRIAHMLMNAPAVGGQYPLPQEKIDPCHLCPHFSTKSAGLAPANDSSPRESDSHDSHHFADNGKTT